MNSDEKKKFNIENSKKLYNIIKLQKTEKEIN